MNYVTSVSLCHPMHLHITIIPHISLAMTNPGFCYLCWEKEKQTKSTSNHSKQLHLCIINCFPHWKTSSGQTLYNFLDYSLSCTSNVFKCFPLWGGIPGPWLRLGNSQILSTAHLLRISSVGYFLGRLSQWLISSAFCCQFQRVTFLALFPDSRDVVKLKPAAS